MEGMQHLFFEGVYGPAASKPAGAPAPSTPRARPAVADVPLDPFYQWLFQRAGLNVDRYRSAALSRRLSACLRALGVPDTDHARVAIDRDPTLLRAAVNSVLLGVTAFYRDRAVFDQIRCNILPRLLAARPGIRVWSAACSEGHELYSVAVLLAEIGALERCELLGTDCRYDAIERARAGIFAGDALTDVDPHRRQTYFSARDRHFHIAETIRAKTRWKVADLLTCVETGPWDLVLWRNMAIYLKPDASAMSWARIVRQMRPGGYIVTGKADHPPTGIGLRRIESSVYRFEGT